MALRKRPEPVPAVRVGLRWREGRWEMERAISVGPAIPVPSATLPKSPSGEYSGFWIEIVGKHGDVLYRRVLQDPTDQSIEVFDRGRPRRAPSRRPMALVDLLLPDLAGAASIRIWGQQVSMEERAPVAVQLAQLPYPRKG